MSTLWNQFRYKSQIHCLIDTPIKEYDITKANISILVDLGLIDEVMYQRLFYEEKYNREVFIGNLIGNNPGLSEKLSSGIKEAKRIFLESNEIKDEDVLEIDNDSVFIIGDRVIKNQQISPHIYFRLDHSFTSFYDVMNIRYYYYCNRISNEEFLKAKGLGTKGTELHKRYMLDFLNELFFTAQLDGTNSAIELLSGFYKLYMSKELDIEYYRELNSLSQYKLIKFGSYSYGTDSVLPNWKKYIDITYNETVLRGFNRLLFYKYLK